MAIPVKLTRLVEICGFLSHCAAIPPPASSNNPLRSKRFWFPRGAFLSELNSTTYLEDKKSSASQPMSS